jgi:hypothetical protein
MTTAIDPRGITWDTYCKRMEELFASDQLGYVEEKDWRLWADGLQGIGYFVMSGIPDSRNYDNWKDWAQAVVGILSIPSN